jgi:hypothetical protein
MSLCFAGCGVKTECNVLRTVPGHNNPQYILVIVFLWGPGGRKVVKKVESYSDGVCSIVENKVWEIL